MKRVPGKMLCLLLTVVFSKGDSPPEILKDASFLQLLNKHYTSVQPPKINLGYGADPNYQNYRPKEDYTFSGSGYESAYGAYDSQYAGTNNNGWSDSETYGRNKQQMQTEKPLTADQQVPVSSQEYWNPTNALTTPWNASQTPSDNIYNDGYYRRPPTVATEVDPYRESDPMQVGYSFHRYQQIRPISQTNYVAVKKPSAYFGKGRIVKIVDSAGKPTNIKLKKVPALPNYYPNHNPNPYKKIAYSKVHTPYVVHKHPTKKIAVPVALHPYYKKYYPYYSPQYLISNKSKKPYGYPEGYSYYRNPETAVTTVAPDAKIPSTTEKYSTTERMDGIYSGKPLNYDDYTSYNDTYNKHNNVNYYETYEEQEESPSQDLGQEHEATTRGYYGDRVYMSTQGPEKKFGSNKLYFVRSEARENDEESETIFD